MSIKSKKLSVIIPVFNSEKYLRQCIESILEQEYSNIEVILVDNGSKDGSIDIEQEFVCKDKRVSFFQENKPGAAAARNCGLERATGDYITFVDSDDYVEKRIYSNMMKIIEDYDADVACCSFHYVYSDGTPTGWYEPELQKYIKGEPIISGIDACKIFLASHDMEGFSWNKVVKREIIKQNHLKFDENKKSYEDMQFVFDIMLNSKKVALCNQKLYFYRQIEQSLTRILYDDRKKDYMDTVDKICNESIKYGLDKYATNYRVVRSISLFYSNVKNNEKVDKSNILPSDISVLTAMYYIIRYQRTDKLKVLAKLIICNCKS